MKLHLRPPGLALVLTGLLLTTIRAAAAPTPSLAFSLQDQFGVTHTEKSWPDKILVVAVGDREGSAFLARWCQALGEALPPDTRSRVQFVGVADLTGVPRLLHGFVRGKFPKDRNAWTLMDWRGHFRQAYGLTPNRCHLLVFRPDGSLATRLGGREVQPGEVAAASAVIQAIPLR